MQQEASKLPEFNEVALQLELAEALISPAEAHGLLSGCVCAGSRISGTSLLEAILGSAAIQATAGRDMLLSLYHISAKQLYEADFTFQLLLPIDDTSLIERARALKEWCQGFISGLGLTGLTAEECQTEDIQNALTHISEIGKLDIAKIIADDADEKAFLEVSEYVRLAVMSIYIEFSKAKGGSDGKTQLNYLH
jgi:yecA family protein